MYGITVSKAAAICGGSVYGLGVFDPEITRIIIDSRKAEPGDLFAAYRGEKADGHAFIASALANGASCALAEYVPDNVTGPVIICDDVQLALEKIITGFRSLVSIPVVGITGSIGKTTAKQMVSAVLAQHYDVLKTAGNLNNLIGLPITVSEIQENHEVAVLEMGINHFGEMRRLGAMAKPDIILYTMIGHAHLEFLGDLQGVLRAKTEALAEMKEDALVIVNGDDTLLSELQCAQRKLSFGRGENCDIRAYDITVDEQGFSRFRISYSGRTVYAQPPAIGEHMVYAALEGAAVGFALGLSDSEIENGIREYETVGRRLSFNTLKGLTLIDDCYNANPDSMKSSISTLCTLKGRHVCILGDMLEQGENSSRMHREIGAFASEKNVAQLLCSGTYASDYAAGFGTGAKCYETKAELINALKSELREGDVVLVKSSLGSGYGEVSDAIKSHFAVENND